MSLFNRGADGLESLRNAAAALKRWRPAERTRLSDARHRIERLIELAQRRPKPLTDPPETDPPDKGDDFAIDDPAPFRSWSGVRGSVGGPGPRSTDRPRDGGSALGRPPPEEGRLRKLERRFPRLRWLLRKVERLALAGRPWLLAARRAAVRHRGKLIWIFVVGASVAMPPV